ncbi:pyridoxamine 5'-phosphate oxidase family protein [Chryseolinea sp. T2]|uniref:pyridoxamine 5'-phosphate oxidase family protein n=1 Tax=Chryseolinea sp. T2 TaxID=3129255 RepID=UPI0030787633
MSSFPQTSNNTITRLPKRGEYDRDAIYAILDEALVCTVAFVRDNLPVQIPTGFCRMGDKLYIHGSVGSGYMRALAEHSVNVCLSVTHVDGLVLARSAFHHSMNYRSAVIFGKTSRVTDEDELYKALEAFTNKVQPGRWDDVRQPDKGEWKATMVLSISIDDASGKVRTGPPKDDEEDYSLDTWAGVVPLKLQRQTPIPDELLKNGVELPQYLK